MRPVLALLVLLISAGPALAEIKLAFVDMQRALLEVDEGKKAKTALEKMKSERQGKLDEQQEALRKMQQELEAQRSFLKPDKLAEKENEFRQKLGELQMVYATLQKELAQEEAKLTKDILGRMSVILTRMGEEQSFTMIFEKTESSLLWAQRHLDITNDVIRRFNAGEGKDGGKATGKDAKKGK